MATEIRFAIDRTCGLALYEQVKGQLLSGLYTGKFKPGDRLPSVREMAQHSGINLKSAQRAYQRLAQDKYVEIRKGSGVFVAERDRQIDERMRRRAIHKLITETIEKARGLGLSPEKLTQLIAHFSNGGTLRKIAVAVVDHAEEGDIFSHELRERLAPADVYVVQPGAPSVPEDSAALELSEYILATSWHLEEAEALARRFQKPVLEIRPNPLISTEILEAAQSRNVALVVRDASTMHGTWDVISLFHPSTDKKFFVASLDRTDSIREIVREAEIIYMTPGCWDEMRRLTPAHADLRTYQSFISDETIATLREIQLYG